MEPTQQNGGMGVALGALRLYICHTTCYNVITPLAMETLLTRRLYEHRTKEDERCTEV